MHCLLFLWPFIACHQITAFAHLDTDSCRSGFRNKSSLWISRSLAKLAQQAGMSSPARAVLRNHYGICDHPAQGLSSVCFMLQGWSPAMWPIGHCSFFSCLPFVWLTELMILDVLAQSFGYSVPYSTMGQIWPDWTGGRDWDPYLTEK